MTSVAVATVVGILLAAVVWGVNAVLFSFWFRAAFLLDEPNRLHASKAVKAFMISLMTLNTLDLIWMFIYVCNSYAVHAGNPTYIPDPAIPVVRQIWQILELCTAQIFMIYRLWVIWGRRWPVVVIPSLLCAALLVTFLYQDAKLYQTNFSYSRLNNSKQVSMAGLATTFVNDIIITSGICIRLVLLTNPTLGVAIKKRNHQLIAVLVESAALTTINVIFEFIAFVREDNVHLLANYISGQLYGLATYIIILRAIKLTVFPANMSNTPRMPSTVSNKPTRFEGLDAPYGAIEEGRERRSSAAQMPSSVYEIRSPSSSKGSPATLLNERFSSKETYTPSPAMEMGTFPTPVYEAASSEGKDTDDDPSNDTSSIPFGLALGTPHDSHHHHWDSHTRGNSRSLGGRALGHRNDSSNENFVQLTTQTLSIVSPPSHSLVQTRAQMNSHDEEFAPVSTSPAPASSASPPPAFTSPEPTSPRSPGGSPAPSRSLRDIKQAMQASQPGAQSPPLHNSSSPFPHSSFVGGYDDY